MLFKPSSPCYFDLSMSLTSKSLLSSIYIIAMVINKMSNRLSFMIIWQLQKLPCYMVLNPLETERTAFKFGNFEFQLVELFSNSKGVEFSRNFSLKFFVFSQALDNLVSAIFLFS